MSVFFQLSILMNIKINAKQNKSITIKNYLTLFMLTDEFPAPSIFSLAYLLFLLIVVVTFSFTFNFVAVIYLPRICQDNLKKTSSKY